MKEKEPLKSKQHKEQTAQESDAEKQQGVAKRASLAIFMLVLLLFAGVLFISYFFELKFGKTAGTVSMILIALIIAGYLYRKEIIEKIKRKK